MTIGALQAPKRSLSIRTWKNEIPPNRFAKSEAPALQRGEATLAFGERLVSYLILHERLRYYMRTHSQQLGS